MNFNITEEEAEIMTQEARRHAARGAGLRG